MAQLAGGRRDGAELRGSLPSPLPRRPGPGSEAPRVSAAAATRSAPLRPGAPSPRPPNPHPGLPFLAVKGELLSQEMSAVSGASLPGTRSGAQGGASLCFPEGSRGRLRSRSGPSHLPGRRRYLHGRNLSGCNFPESLRPAPRDAARARAPAGRSAARGPAELRAAAAPPLPRPCCSAPQSGLPARARGRQAGGLVTCPGRSRNSSGGEESFPNIRGIKKSLPQLSSSSSRLHKTVSSTTEKTVHRAVRDYQPCDVFKKGRRVKASKQKSSTMNAGPSWSKARRPKHPSGKAQGKPQVPPTSSQPKSGPVGVSHPAEDELGERILPEGKAESGPLGARGQGAPGSKLFLDFQSMAIITEGADDDSASDLSDSERVPIPPSPLTPPDLRLRAEEIDPVSFCLHPGQGPARPEYCYPDFLPPPFSAWDLRAMAVLLNAERRPGAAPRTGGALGKYIDRLLQLEWLQVQTVQGERGKGARAKPPPAAGATGALKSPGRSKLVPPALPRPHQEGAPKSGPSRKKAFHRQEGHPPDHAAGTPAVHVLSGSRPCSQKQSLDTRTEDKKKKASRSARLQCWDPAGSDVGPKIESTGNIRTPRQSAVILEAADSYRACKTPAHANLKKKGNANNCGHAALSGEKKLKTNGGKQTAHKFK